MTNWKCLRGLEDLGHGYKQKMPWQAEEGVDGRQGVKVANTWGLICTPDKRLDVERLTCQLR